MSHLDQKIKGLLAKRILKEKVGQLIQLKIGELPQADDPNFERTLKEKLVCGSIGVICISPRDSNEESKKKIDTVQKYLRTETSHGIPALAVAETLHGLLSPGATIFPQAIALGSTWNPGLIKSIDEAIAREATSMNINQALAPVLDLGRAPRFCRIEECLGECPTLVKTLGLAYIQGMQGDNPTEKLADDKLRGFSISHEMI